MTVGTICKEIEQINDKTALKILSRAIKTRWGELAAVQAQEAITQFRVGDKVQFEAKGEMVTGTVLWINQKSLAVKTDNGRWRVHPSLLTKVTA